jgi:general secretion pathway protein D
VLSRPQIMTLNNVPASVLVGQRVPQITDFQQTNVGSTVNSIDLIDVGISLGVIPRVTPDGLIIMDIEANDSKVGDPADGITVGVSDGVPIQSPIYDDITAITTIAARSGQTVVFGGLITSNRSTTFRGVPYLSQIPILGRLFRFDTTADSRNELVFFLTPHIIMDDRDLEMLNQREADRMSWCLADVIDLHGDPGFGMSSRDRWHDGTPLIYPHLDPTAEGVLMHEGAEPVPIPRDRTLNGPGQAPTEARPFVLPPGELPEGKPFILPPAERTEGEPFILPPEQRQPGRPFVEPPRESQRRNPGTAPTLQRTSTWHAPQLQAPWQTPGPAAQGAAQQPGSGPLQSGTQAGPQIPVPYGVAPAQYQHPPYPPPQYPGAWHPGAWHPGAPYVPPPSSPAPHN